jgi:hypothetical protein
MQYLLIFLLIRIVNTYLYIALAVLMFTLGLIFSLFPILSAKTEANFPITHAKIQILGSEIGLSWHIVTSLLSGRLLSNYLELCRITRRILKKG